MFIARNNHLNFELQEAEGPPFGKSGLFLQPFNYIGKCIRIMPSKLISGATVAFTMELYGKPECKYLC